MNSSARDYILPDWPAPAYVKAACSTRTGGFSRPPYDTFNLGLHCGDTPEQVMKNRAALMKDLACPQEPFWLQQVHGKAVIELNQEEPKTSLPADASFARQATRPCVVMTADCLPILLCSQDEPAVAAIHAGWRGLAHGVIESTLKGLQLPGKTLMAWLGPAIGPRQFEVDPEVRDEFLRSPFSAGAADAFVPNKEGKYLANLYDLARHRLRQQGVTSIYGGQYCTMSDEERFYSYRRDGASTGRMVSLVWIEDGV